MKFLLLPISFLYHIILKIRHKLYDWHILKSKRFDAHVICVGNLALGGTGKTPHVEYLINLLKEQYCVSVVSRGYGRKTKGFLLADARCSTETVGDEPLQYVNKFNDITVAVDENRNEAIERLSAMDRPPEVYLLDDAYQHRSTQAGLNVLLTSYHKLYCEDFLVPAGTLRDIRSEAKRADLIVVSKCPADLSDREKREIIKSLKPAPHQDVFFSSMEDEPLKSVNVAADEIDPGKADAVMLFCGIANPNLLIYRIKKHYQCVDTLAFTDHHAYSEKDIETILKHYQNLKGEKKITVTTEKDLARLTNSPYLCQFESVPLFVAPVSVNMHQQEEFNKKILDYVRKDHLHS